MVSIFIFAAGLALKSAADPDTGSEFSWHQARIEIRDHVGWLDAIFAAVYAGFYARYASQWSYLASLYNQIMATASSISDEQRQAETFLNWQAAFIEDCYFLHLDSRAVFSIAIRQMLGNATLLKCFAENAPEEVVEAVLSRNAINRPA